MQSQRILTVVAVVALLVTALAAGVEFTILSRSYPTTVTVSTTRTITLSSSSGSPVVIEDVIIQSEVINGICFLGHANTTSTAYLIGMPSGAGSIGSQVATTTITTETLIALWTTTIYYNVTMVSSGSTCTLVNPHYNVTQSSTCPPCV